MTRPNFRPLMSGAAVKWSADFRRALQRKLKDEGHYAGDIDGRMGGGIKDALDRLAKARTASP